jgi:uncharacterized protein (TIGR00266 family)
MQWEIAHKPEFSVLKVKLANGEQVYAEPGAMIYMRGNIEVESEVYGGIKKALLRKFLGGESIFLNRYTALEDNAEIGFAPVLPGEIAYIELSSAPYIVQKTAYLAHHGNVNIEIAWKGLKGFIAEDEFFYLKLSGTGGAWVWAYGALETVDLKPGEEIIVDTSYLVAFEDTISWEVSTVGKSLKTKILSGEGFVMKLRGPGKVILQTRSLPTLLQMFIKLHIFD